MPCEPPELKCCAATNVCLTSPAVSLSYYEFLFWTIAEDFFFKRRKGHLMNNMLVGIFQKSFKTKRTSGDNFSVGSSLLLRTYSLLTLCCFKIIRLKVI